MRRLWNWEQDRDNAAEYDHRGWVVRLIRIILRRSAK